MARGIAQTTHLVASLSVAIYGVWVQLAMPLAPPPPALGVCMTKKNASKQFLWDPKWREVRDSGDEIPWKEEYNVNFLGFWSSLIWKSFLVWKAFKFQYKRFNLKKLFYIYNYYPIHLMTTLNESHSFPTIFLQLFLCGPLKTNWKLFLI